ncbi:MAG: SRPBCC domain-containing protein [Luteitalea sp.]|nr:SRPBCC domain-containing protein [Luteitalea sp.]
MPATAPALDNLSVNITQEVHVRSSIAATFAALLEEIGPEHQIPDGPSMPLTLEPWPGGRWFRDLGDDNGHFWGHVQAIKRPTLLEITGPLMISAPVVANVQYRLKEVDGGTLVTLRHTMFGPIPEGYSEGMAQGVPHLFERIRRRAEAA